MLSFMNFRPVGAVFHVDGEMDGRTDMTMLIVAFLKLANAQSPSFFVDVLCVNPARDGRERDLFQR